MPSIAPFQNPGLPRKRSKLLRHRQKGVNGEYRQIGKIGRTRARRVILRRQRRGRGNRMAAVKKEIEDMMGDLEERMRELAFP